MEGLRLLAGVAAFTLALSCTEPAAARRRNAEAETNAEGVRVTVTVGEDGSASVTAVGGGGDDSGCDWRVIQYPFQGSDAPRNYGEPPSPEANLYLIYCGEEFVSAQWIVPRERVPIVDTEALARTVVDDIPVDLASIDARPEGKAVTGIPSYFWVEGYDGAPIEGTVRNGPVSVDVAVTLGSVTWDFGDGTEPITSTELGEAWPARSEIRHAYADRGTYTVTITLRLPAEFRVNGGSATALPDIVRTATLTYVVDEVQAVRDR